MLYCKIQRKILEIPFKNDPCFLFFLLLSISIPPSRNACSVFKLFLWKDKSGMQYKTLTMFRKIKSSKIV